MGVTVGVVRGLGSVVVIFVAVDMVAVSVATAGRVGGVISMAAVLAMVTMEGMQLYDEVRGDLANMVVVINSLCGLGC
jgi:hypothetical protein